MPDITPSPTPKQRNKIDRSPIPVPHRGAVGHVWVAGKCACGAEK